VTRDAVIALLPFAVLVIGAGTCAIWDRLLPADDRASRWLGAAFAIAGAGAALIAGPGVDALNGAMRRDASAVFFVALVGIATAAALALDATVRRAAARMPVPLVLIAALAAALLACAGDLLLMLVSLELLFMSVLSLVARAPRARFASRVLFVAGGTASALFAAGVGVAWSASGTFSIGGLSSSASTGTLIATGLAVAGLSAFVAFAPLHVWLGPVAAALPAPGALFVCTVPRVAALAALLRCGAAITAASPVEWRACLAVLAATSLIVGATFALGERSVRRIVVHLSIAYVGGIGVAASAGLGANAAIAVAAATLVTVLVGLFAIIVALPEGASVDALRGIARRRPILTIALGVLLLGLAGLPPTIGFVARLAIFEVAIDAQLAWLVFVAALATVASAAAAARLAFACLDAGEGSAARGRGPVLLATASAVLVLLGGIAPGPLLELARGVRF